VTICYAVLCYMLPFYNTLHYILFALLACRQHLVGSGMAPVVWSAGRRRREEVTQRQWSSVSWKKTGFRFQEDGVVWREHAVLHFPALHQLRHVGHHAILHESMLNARTCQTMYRALFANSQQNDHHRQANTQSSKPRLKTVRVLQLNSGHFTIPCVFRISAFCIRTGRRQYSLTEDIYRVAQKSNPLWLIVIKSY